MEKIMICLGLAMGFACALRPVEPARPTEKVAAVCDIKILAGDQLLQAKSFFVTQRLKVFREYPYLYVGTEEWESSFFDGLVANPDSALAAAYVGGELVGFVSGWPLTLFCQHMKGLEENCVRAGFVPARYYYFGEAIVLPEHRDKYLGLRMAAALEAYARSRGYVGVCGADESHDSHPLKPANYREKHEAARRFGFVKSAVISEMEWPTVQPDGSTKMQNHVLTYWFKELQSVAAPE